MKIAYELIFGETWGGGHYSRAMKLLERSQFDIDFYIHFENAKDKTHLFHKQHLKPVNTQKNYDLHIIDTLGKFCSPFKARETIMLDGLYAESTKQITHEHLLYPHSNSTEFRFKSFISGKIKLNVGIIQGSSDDHKQISKISAAIPSKYHQTIFSTDNCRHLDRLRKLSENNQDIDILINCRFPQYLEACDYIITAGGNSLLEILETGYSGKIIIYSKELKEHQTINLYSKDPRVVKVFRYEENFVWDIRSND